MFHSIRVVYPVSCFRLRSSFIYCEIVCILWKPNVFPVPSSHDYEPYVVYTFILAFFNIFGASIHWNSAFQVYESVKVVYASQKWHHQLLWLLVLVPFIFVYTNEFFIQEWQTDGPVNHSHFESWYERADHFATHCHRYNILLADIDRPFSAFVKTVKRQCTARLLPFANSISAYRTHFHTSGTPYAYFYSLRVENVV